MFAIFTGPARIVPLILFFSVISILLLLYWYHEESLQSHTASNTAILRIAFNNENLWLRIVYEALFLWIIFSSSISKAFLVMHAIQHYIYALCVVKCDIKKAHVPKKLRRVKKIVDTFAFVVVFLFSSCREHLFMAKDSK